MVDMTTTTTAFRSSSDPDVRREAFARRAGGETYAAIARALNLRNGTSAYDAVEAFARQNGANIPGYSAERGARTSAGIRARRSSGRRFGMEIEVMGINVNQARDALVAAGFDAYVQPYIGAGAHAVPQAGRWKVITDASCPGGAEVVTPPLSGTDAHALIRKAMKALRDAGARIERNCGLHVHHEVDDLTGDELARLVEFYSAHGRAIDALLAPSRRQRHAGYPCGPMASHEVVDFGRRLRAITTTDKAAKKAAAQAQGIGGRPESRYRAINVHAFGNYGTIEFRQHQGTLNATKAIAWLRLGQAIIEAVRHADTVDTSTFLADLLAAGRLSQADHDYLAQRQAALAGR